MQTLGLRSAQLSTCDTSSVKPRGRPPTQRGLGHGRQHSLFAGLLKLPEPLTQPRWLRVPRTASPPLDCPTCWCALAVPPQSSHTRGWGRGPHTHLWFSHPSLHFLLSPGLSALLSQSENQLPVLLSFSAVSFLSFIRLCCGFDLNWDTVRACCVSQRPVARIARPGPYRPLCFLRSAACTASGCLPTGHRRVAGNCGQGSWNGGARGAGGTLAQVT